MPVRKVKEFSTGMEFIIDERRYSITYFPTRSTVQLKLGARGKKLTMSIASLRKDIEDGEIIKTGWY
jgi:hypothetical protein